MSLTFVEVPILFVVVVIYGNLSYWMVGLNGTFRHFAIFFVTIFLVINVGFAVSQLISAAVKTTSMAIAVYMIVLVYSLLLGGFIVPKKSIPSAMQWALKVRGSPLFHKTPVRLHC